jgi:hypothetical protein
VPKDNVIKLIQPGVFDDTLADDQPHRKHLRLSAVGLLPLRCGIAWSASYAVQANTILCQTVPDPA